MAELAILTEGFGALDDIIVSLPRVRDRSLVGVVKMVRNRPSHSTDLPILSHSNLRTLSVGREEALDAARRAVDRLLLPLGEWLD